MLCKASCRCWCCWDDSGSRGALLRLGWAAGRWQPLAHLSLSSCRLCWAWCWAGQMGRALGFSLLFWGRSATQSCPRTPRLPKGLAAWHPADSTREIWQEALSIASSSELKRSFRGLGCSQDGLSVQVAFFHRWLQVRSFGWGTHRSWQLSYSEFIYSSLFSTRVVLSLP